MTRPRSITGRLATAAVAGCALAAGLPSGAGAAPPVAGATTIVTRDVNGGAPSATSEPIDISHDGRFVLFQSAANDLVPGAANGEGHLYVFDRLTGVNERVSVNSAEQQANALVRDGAISANGRWVSFTSDADNLVASDDNETTDVFVRDRASGTTVRASVAQNGDEANGQALVTDISDDGRYVAFETGADNLVPGEPSNAFLDIYVKDMDDGSVAKISQSTLGVDGNAASRIPEITGDGRFVVFESTATTLVLNDLNGVKDVFVHDTTNGATTRVSLSSAEAAGNADSLRGSISDDGRYVAFNSAADNLASGESGDDFNDIYLRDRSLGTTIRITDTNGGTKANEDSFGASISSDGSRVTFHTFAANLGAPSGGTAVMLFDLPASHLVKAPANPGGSHGGSWPEVSGNGRYVTYSDRHVDGVTLGRGYLRFFADDEFPDVAPSFQFFEQISWMVHEELTTGYDDGTFRPAATLTRQAVAAFLYRYAGEPPFAPPADPTFSDVGTAHAFFHEIEWAVDEGLVAGFSDGTFKPAGVITRQAVAAFLYRLRGEPPVGLPPTPTFSDVGPSNNFYAEIEWMAGTNVGGGFADGTFKPRSAVTRQSLSAFLFRFEWVFGGPSL
jgi:hypothetical protein